MDEKSRVVKETGGGSSQRQRPTYLIIPVKIERVQEEESPEK